VRIGFLTPEFVTEPNFAGGLAQYLNRVTSGLAQRGHDVEVFVAADTEETIDHHGVRVHRTRPRKLMRLRLVNLSLGIADRQRLTKLQLACSTARGLNGAFCRRASVEQFDIVQAASWLGTAYFAAKNPWTPVVVRASSFEDLLFPHRGQEMSLDQKMYNRFETAAMRRSAAVYAPSRYLAGEIQKATGISSHVLNPPYLSRNGLTSEGRHTSLGEWRDFAVYFGKVAKYKGAGLLADALEPVLADGRGIRLAIAGPVENDSASKKLLNLVEMYPDSVRYLGCLRHEALMSVVKDAKIVVLPSLMDNLPNTCLEAMAMRKVVVGPAGVSFDELITDGESGILFRMGDSVSLRHAILQGWDLSDERRRAMGDAAETRIRCMAPATTLQELELFYADVIDDAKRRKRVQRM